MADRQRFQIVTKRSRIVAEVRSTLQELKVEASIFDGWFEVSLAGRRLEPSPSPMGGVTVEVRGLRSGNRLFDLDLQRTLEMKKYPLMVGELRQVTAGDADGSYRVRGELRMHGEQQAVEGDAKVTFAEDGSIGISAEMVLNFEDFGVKARRLLMLKVLPEVRIRGEVVAVAVR